MIQTIVVPGVKFLGRYLNDRKFKLHIPTKKNINCDFGKRGKISTIPRLAENCNNPLI